MIPEKVGHGTKAIPQSLFVTSQKRLRKKSTSIARAFRFGAQQICEYKSVRLRNMKVTFQYDAIKI